MAKVTRFFMSRAAEAEHVGHGIEPGLPAPRPARGGQRPAGEDHTAFGAVGDLEALVRAGEDQRVVAHYRAAAQGRKTNVARSPGAGVAVAALHRALAEIDLAPCRRGGTEHERRARRRVDLAVVVHLEDLDV